MASQPQFRPRPEIRVVRSSVPGLAGREMPIQGEVAWIGRELANDFVVADPSVSRRHAWLEVAADGQVKVHDNDSSNGLFVRGRKTREAVLQDGHRFTIGSTTFELTMATKPKPLPPQSGIHRTVLMRDIGELAAQFEQPKPLEDLGEGLVVAANRPFLIADPTSVWLVESGKVEIFTVDLEAGRPAGSRDHFLTVDSGAAFFGLAAELPGHESGFLANAKPGTELRRFDVERLQLLAPVPAHRERLAPLVDGWVSALSRVAGGVDATQPESKVTLKAGEEASLGPGGVAVSRSGALWIELPAAHFLFDGIASLSYAAEGVLFPLAPGAWLELLTGEQEIQVLPLKTADVIHDPRLWAGLEVFHRALVECELLNRRFEVVDEFERLERKAARGEAARQEGVGAIEAVLGGTRAWERPTFAATDIGPVFDACDLVGSAMGIEVQRPVGELDELSFDETLVAISAASRFRTRKIALADDWWNLDSGPLLGQRDEGKTPVALLPVRGGYDCVDTVTGVRILVDEEFAATLTPFAHSFYRPFPDGPILAKKLVAFVFRGMKKEFRQVALMGIAVGLLSTATPMITGMVFDTAIPQAERAVLLQLSLGILLVALTSSAFRITQNVAMLRVQSKVDYAGQAAVWDRLLNLPVNFFRRYSAGDLADRAAGIDKIRAIVSGAGVAALLGSFASLFNAAQMFVYSAALAGVAISMTLVYVGLTTLFNYLKLRLERREMHQRGHIAGVVLQLISGVSKLRVTGAEDHSFRVWATAFAAMRSTAFKVGRISNLMPVMNGAFPVLSSMAIFYTMVTLKQAALEKGQPFDLSTGDFLAFTAAYGIFSAAMQALGDASIGMLAVIPVFERLKPILVEEPEVDGSKAAPARLAGGIELSHVSFRYSEDTPWVLRDVSLEIRPGEFVAIVGGSGSGKSTLMKVMLGFERPEKGGVYYDGQDLSTLDVRLVRQQLGVVLQESRLLPADIYRNIVGSSARTVAEAWEAAAKAGLADDIKRLPMGMHTYVSEGGGGFSGGQKQRLMIARALVHSPKILFLDEATSALDNLSQAIVTESMDRLQATRIVIAHRLNTIANADRICYLDQGVIREQGTYEELMEKNGLFADLARRQLA